MAHIAETEFDMAKHDSSSQPGDKSKVASSIKDVLGGVAATGAAAMATDTEAFTKNATSAILYELKAGDVAMRRARRDDVREFAAHMKQDFERIRSDLNSFLGGTEEPTQPPQQPIKLHEVLLEDLNGASDEDFDDRYIAQQKLAHLEAITLFKSYQSRGDNDGLKNLCRVGLPVLEEHARQAERLG